MFKKFVAGVSLLAVSLLGVQAAPAQATPAPAAEAALHGPGAPPKVTAANTARPKGVKGWKGNPSLSGGVSTQARTSCSGSGCYHYVGGSQTIANTGAYANMTVNWAYSDTYASDSGAHNIVEIAAQSQTSVTCGTCQTVEVGINADRGMYSGNDDPHLFVFWWKNGVGQCYNGCGFVRYTGSGSSPVGPGDSISGDTGTAKKVGIEYTSGNWWVSYNNLWVGYFPGNSPGTSTANNLWYPSTFTSAAKTQLFGEVASSYNEPCTDMGNGRQGNGTASSPYNYNTMPGYVSSASLVPGTITTSLGMYVTPSTTQYTQNAISARTFYYGGPGWNSTGGTPGTTGSC